MFVVAFAAEINILLTLINARPLRISQMKIIAVAALAVISLNMPAFSSVHSDASNASAIEHGGGLNSAGCHNDRKRGTYHCH